MNATSSLELISRTRRFPLKVRLAANLKSLATFLAKQAGPNASSSCEQPPRKSGGLRSEELVWHGGYGAGRIVSRWPDGRLLILFAEGQRNRLIFPSQLDRTNGRRL